MSENNRSTTREAAKVLKCRPSEAINLLRAANVNATRCGAAWLWNAAQVQHLAETLKKRNTAPAAHAV